MQVKVVKDFRDKYSSELFKEGDIIDNITNERCAEINSTPFGKFVEVLNEEEKVEEVKEEKTAVVRKGKKETTKKAGE